MAIADYLASLPTRTGKGVSLTPYRLSYRGGLYNTLLGVRLSRVRLSKWVSQEAQGRPDDVTVVLGHRNRATHRTRNAVRSIREQDYPHGKIRILIVDYGSRPGDLDRIRRIAEQFEADCVSVPAAKEWNRSHCLNVGIRLVKTTFLMICDVDALLAPNYLRVAREALSADPLAVVLASWRWLPESVDDTLKVMALEEIGWDVDRFRELGVVKTDGAYSTGLVFTYAEFARRLRGYDEFFVGWGSEDVDFVKRLFFLGLDPVSINSSSYYLHQWHPRNEGVPHDLFLAQKQRNAEYEARSHTVVRNPSGWGEAESKWLVGPHA